MKKLLTLLSMSYMFWGFSTSYASMLGPETCPSPNAIKAETFFIQKDFTTSDGRTFYIATQEDQKYDTSWEKEWHFEIWDIQANSRHEAREILNNALPALAIKTGPQKNPFGWNCDYSITGLKGSAYTDFDNALSVSMMRQRS